MVCIAAFVILLVIWLFNPVLHLLEKKKQADNISKNSGQVEISAEELAASAEQLSNQVQQFHI